MRQTLKTIIFIIYFLTLVGCNEKKKDESENTTEKIVYTPKFRQTYPSFNNEKFRDVLKVEVENNPRLLSFYSKNDYSSIWVQDTLNTTSVKQLVTILSDAQNHGISPAYFYKDKISLLCDSIDDGIFSENLSVFYLKLSQLEELSTLAVIQYARGMSFGFLTPSKLYNSEEYAIQTLRPDSTYYADLYSDIEKNPIEAAIKSRPTDSIYNKIKDYYQLYSSLRDTAITKITDRGEKKNFKLGDKNKIFSAITDRLSRTGEYNVFVDSVRSDTTHMVLDSTLLAAINKFRRNNSYTEEKEIGKFTFDALNRPYSYYMEMLRANMERYRWKRKKSSEERSIEVNVAAFKLLATSPDTTLQMNVCVGSPKNKTPLLQSQMSYINLNPTWNVPRNIARNEILVHQKKDQSYLKRNNMKLFKSGKEMDPTNIDWRKLDPSKATFYVRQESGNGNSLGRLKFMFSNSFSVYLHDTPAQKPFSKSNRAVSHGCVRLQRPVDLAFFCTSPSTDLYKDRLLYSIDRNPKSTEGKKKQKEGTLKKIPDIINLKDPISLFIDYYTAYVLPNDTTLYFADDIYSYDKIIQLSLDSLVMKNK